MQPDKGWDYNPGKDLTKGIDKALDNKRGKVSGVLLSALDNHLRQFKNPMPFEKIIAAKETANVIKQLENTHPDWFPDGIKGVYRVADDDFFAAYIEGNLFLSNHEDRLSGFRPFDDLTGAFNAIALNKSMTMNQEYSIETLWHEIIHSTNRHVIDTPRKQSKIVEMLVQRVARETYPILLAVYGVNAIHQQSIIASGYGYHALVSNFNWLINRLSVDVVKLEKIVKQQNFSAIYADLVDEMVGQSRMSKDAIKKIFTYLHLEDLNAFRAKVENVFRYHNKKP